ncbi:MAG TPA: ATP synthase F0 subunit B [Blastocatellia bacterium]|nr:ATP synthase F0 subunit B [Blastocatellia bacterium]
MLLELILPALLLAGQSAEAGGFFKNADLWRVINLLIFVVILVYLLRNKIRIGQVFDNRAASIVKELEQAREEKQAAERKLAELEARLGRLDQEVEEIRAQFERESRAEAERISQSAQADAEKFRQTAQREIEGAMRAARSELRQFVAEHSVKVAEEIIRREIRPEDNSRMFTKFVDELQEVNR